MSLWAGVRYEVTVQCGELNSERGCVLYPAPLLWVRLLSQRLSNTPRQFHTACICEQLRKWRCGSFQSHQRRHSRLHLLSFVAPSLIIFACFTWFFLRVTWMQQVCTDTKIILGSLVVSGPIMLSGKLHTSSGKKMLSQNINKTALVQIFCFFALPESQNGFSSHF